MAENGRNDDLRALVIKRKIPLAEGIWGFELVAPDGGDLHPFTAGAHLAVRTPSGAMRHYSLANDPRETDRYVLGVKAEAGGRGGSRSLAEETAEGDTLAVSAPKNDFTLEPAPAYLLIAGGIGITPILSMARQLKRLGTPFKLIYCTRGPEVTAFRDELTSPAFAPHVILHHDGGDPDRAYDFWSLCETPRKAHIYCCGPKPLMEEVRGVTGHWPAGSVHFEDFSADVDAVQADDTPFTVRNARTGKTYEIPADQTILETLRAAGEDMASSCESGTCGTCKTVLVDGDVDHRDMVLSDSERLEYVMICVSRARGDTLVLDW
jgi:phthalate 4,5-dioxygenase reductase subunit